MRLRKKNPLDMSDTKGFRLKPPSPLPQGPVSKVAFKVFLNQWKAYLEQDYNNYLFLPEGSMQCGGGAGWRENLKLDRG